MCFCLGLLRLSFEVSHPFANKKAKGRGHGATGNEPTANSTFWVRTKGESMTNAAPSAESKVHEFTTQSGADTIEVGRKLAGLLKPPQLLLLRGDLGTGKTTLVKGIAQALDAADPDEVTSPTFTLMHEYEGTREGKPVKLYHLDVYRLEGERQLETLGIEELLTPDALVLVEWGDKFKSIRKLATGEITITAEGGDARKITVTMKD
jgi:tRNA threonylcarbamoyladenosine biosynthesis protein TsaE